MKKSYLLSFLSVLLIHCIFFVFWLITTKFDATLIRTFVTLLETIVDIFLPIGILIFLFIKQSEKRWIILGILFSLILGIFGTFMHYFNWGFCTNRFFHPDFETKWIFIALVELNMISILILGVVLQITLLIKSKK